MSGYQKEYADPPQKKTKIEVDGVIFNQETIALSYDPSAFSPFNALANEVIEHLFTFLDRGSLKMSLLVDKRWNKILSNSLKVMKKLPLTIRLTRGAENQELKKFERRYRVVKFKNVEKKLPKYIVDALAKIGSEVETVTFSDCSFEYKILEVSLNCFPKIENVAIQAEQCDRSAKPKVQLDANVIKNLKTLKIDKVASIIESFVGAHQLTELHVNPVWNDWRHLINLLVAQTRLNKVYLLNMIDITTDIKLMPLKCKVQVLSLNGFYPGITDKLLQFVKLFSSSVINLAVRGKHDSHELLLPMIHDNFKVLKYLALSRFFFPSPEFYDQQLKKFDSLKGLRVEKIKFRNNPELAQFFSLFPLMKQLQISSLDFDPSITPEDIKNMTQQLVNVECLVVGETVGLMQHAAFKNLKEIQLKSFDAAEKIDWKRIIENNPEMKCFEIEIESNKDQLDFESLMQCRFSRLGFFTHGARRGFKMKENSLRSFMASPAQKIVLIISKSK